jgi:hypothetical protein
MVEAQLTLSLCSPNSIVVEFAAAPTQPEPSVGHGHFVYAESSIPQHISLKRPDESERLPLGTRRRRKTSTDSSEIPCRLSKLRAQLVEQRLGTLQVGSVETLGEPAVNVCEHRAASPRPVSRNNRARLTVARSSHHFAVCLRAIWIA